MFLMSGRRSWRPRSPPSPGQQQFLQSRLLPGVLPISATASPAGRVALRLLLRARLGAPTVKHFEDHPAVGAPKFAVGLPGRLSSLLHRGGHPGLEGVALTRTCPEPRRPMQLLVVHSAGTFTFGAVLAAADSLGCWPTC